MEEKNIEVKKVSYLDMAKKERLEYLVETISQATKEFQSAQTEETTNKALEKLATEINFFSSQPCFNEIKFDDLAGTVRSTQLHNVTRNNLCEFIEKFLQNIRGLIAEEERKKEQAKTLKNLFLQLAEHAEELVGFIDITKIFK
jgi:hypothetical protein